MELVENEILDYRGITKQYKILMLLGTYFGLYNKKKKKKKGNEKER